MKDKPLTFKQTRVRIEHVGNMLLETREKFANKIPDKSAKDYYKLGMRDALEFMKRSQLIKDYDFSTGKVTMEER